MSDIDLNVSPSSDFGSDDEKPPTPGSHHENQEDEIDVDVDVLAKDAQNEETSVKSPNGSEHEESREEIEQTAKRSIQEDDISNEESNQLRADEKQHTVSSPVSMEMEIDETVENTDHADVNKENLDEKGPYDAPVDSAKGDLAPNKDLDALRHEGTVEASVMSHNAKLFEKNENDNETENEDSAPNEGDIEDSTGSVEKAPEVDENSERADLGEKEEKAEVEHEDLKSKDDSGTFEDSDLLHMTEISGLSVDLTGDEEAIVQDILQNAGDDELLSGGGGPLDISEKKAGDETSDTLNEKSRKSSKDGDDEQEEQPGGTGELMNDIFGSSDEEEEFEGFKDDDLHGRTKIKKKDREKQEKKAVIASDDEGESSKPDVEAPAEAEASQESLTVPPPKDSDSESDGERKSEVFVSDFDLMMEQKKEENRKARRRRKNFDIINDNDDLVVGIIKRMQEAAKEDRLANEARQAATKKLKLLPTVLKHMLKIDLMVTFIDCNVLPVLKEWLSPLPDGSLPHIQIREGILKILEQFPPVDSGALKVSGIGRAVMYLFKHPKESRKNKERAGKLISEWSRPIFGVTANFKSMTREEREKRDYANMSKRRRLSSDAADGGRTPKRIENAIQSDSKALRPGDKGWCMRARVPMPSHKDYVVRPKSNIELVDFSKTSKKSLNRFEKQKRKFNEKKTSTKQRAVEISLEGRKMAL